MLEFIQSADWSILHWIQENLRCGALDALLPKLTLLGEAGAIWIAVAIGLLLTKKYRKYGVCLSLALVAGLLICNVGLKNIVARPRPCWLESIDLLVKIPGTIPSPRDIPGPPWPGPGLPRPPTGGSAMRPSLWRQRWPFPGCTCLCISHRMCWRGLLWARCWAFWLRRCKSACPANPAGVKAESSAPPALQEGCCFRENLS